jgi:hypothetical protein
VSDAGCTRWVILGAALALAQACAPRIEPVPAYVVVFRDPPRTVSMSADDAARIHARLMDGTWRRSWVTSVPGDAALMAPGIHLELYGTTLVGRWQGDAAQRTELSGDGLRLIRTLLAAEPVLPSE